MSHANADTISVFADNKEIQNLIHEVTPNLSKEAQEQMRSLGRECLFKVTWYGGLYTEAKRMLDEYLESEVRGIYVARVHFMRTQTYKYKDKVIDLKRGLLNKMLEHFDMEIEDRAKLEKCLELITNEYF